VQGIFPLGYGGAGIRLTTALFYSPNGQKISKVGVTPKIEVASPHTVARPVSGVSELKIVGSDAVLDAGIRAAASVAAPPAISR
jgi:C-terminal processing protease CtpA/Prc